MLLAHHRTIYNLDSLRGKPMTEQEVFMYASLAVFLAILIGFAIWSRR